ncbi:MAG: hypothetical protein COA97_09085 [Flavobacteriales bacterium]|nr:MAG: hypothetical protein COA97_09085 [Flavobacteriales bacterium]
MKKRNLLIASIFCLGIAFTSCSKSNCKECTNCQTLANATLCEDDFEKTSNYNDQVENYESDGCTCSTK